MRTERSASRRLVRLVLATVTLGAVLSVAPRLAFAEVPSAAVESIDLASVPSVPVVPTVASGTTVAGTTARMAGIEPFQMVALSWAGPASAAPALRTITDGVASDRDVVAESLGADTATGEGLQVDRSRVRSEPTWVGSADGFEVTPAAGTTDVQVHLVRIHQELRVVDATESASSHSAGTQPSVHTRAEWNAAAATAAPAYASSVRFAVVHHTVGSNSYAPSDVPSIINGIQAYHQQVNGWSDIGYNFLVDAFGGVWEGRGGGIAKAVIGAHAGGFNTGSVGVAVLGNFETAEPTAASLDAVATIIGWKLAIGGADPIGSVTVTAGYTDVTPKYPQGTVVTIPTISGHRDVNQTACPGLYLYARLNDIRYAAAAKYANVFGNFENASPAPGGVWVSGWAIDRSTTGPISIDVYVDGSYAGSGWAANNRPDLAAWYPQAGTQHGFAFAVPFGGLGTHTVCAYGINDGGEPNYLVGCRQVTRDVQPVGHLDAMTLYPGAVVLNGWALDPDTYSSAEIDVLIDGRFAGFDSAAGSRPDVAAIYPAYGPAHGFSIGVGLPLGTHTVCGYAINVGSGQNLLLGCQVLTLGSAPIGHLEDVRVGPGYVVVGGWALDPQTASSVEIDILVDGAFAAFDSAAASRPDIAALYPAWGAAHGFSIGAALPLGQHTVCVYAINVGVGVNTELGCPVVVR